MNKRYFMCDIIDDDNFTIGVNGGTIQEILTPVYLSRTAIYNLLSEYFTTNYAKSIMPTKECVICGSPLDAELLTKRLNEIADRICSLAVPPDKKPDDVPAITHCHYDAFLVESKDQTGIKSEVLYLFTKVDELISALVRAGIAREK